MKKHFEVVKEYLEKKGFDYQTRADSDFVSKHETLENALETLRKEKTSILSWEELNERYEPILDVLSIAEVDTDDDDEIVDYVIREFYAVV